MGLFEKVFAKEPQAPVMLNKQECFLAIALAISAADGHISQSEVEGIVAYLRRMRMFESTNGNQMVSMFDKLVGIIRRQGVESLVQLAREGLPTELRETAFACAVDIAFADGVVDDSEKKLIDELQKILEVPENIALTIVQVMMIKNRG
jgi:tellurite resistance protein